MRLGYLGVDQNGQRYKIDKYPRKELCERLGYNPSSAQIMYTDYRNGPTRKTGYVIGGLWINVYEVHEWSTA